MPTHINRRCVIITYNIRSIYIYIYIYIYAYILTCRLSWAATFVENPVCSSMACGVYYAQQTTLITPFLIMYEWSLYHCIIHNWDHETHWRLCIYQNRLSLNPAWLRNYSHYKAWDDITYPFTNFDGAAIEVLKWISNVSHTLLVMWLLIHVGKLIRVCKRGPRYFDWRMWFNALLHYQTYCCTKICII